MRLKNQRIFYLITLNPEELSQLELQQVQQMVENYKTEGYVHHLATYLREWQRDCALDKP